MSGDAGRRPRVALFEEERQHGLWSAVEVRLRWVGEGPDPEAAIADLDADREAHPEGMAPAGVQDVEDAWGAGAPWPPGGETQWEVRTTGDPWPEGQAPARGEMARVALELDTDEYVED